MPHDSAYTHEERLIGGGANVSNPSLGEYSERLFGSEDQLLHDMRLEAEKKGIPAIQVPLDLGRLLATVIMQSGAKRILEIGTLFGYSAILMARALPPEGRIVTLEVNRLHASIAENNFSRAKVDDKVEVRQGPALASLEQLQQDQFDLVFIDADKDTYPEYLDWALRLTHPGSVIMADNVWRGGAAVEPGPDDSASRGIAAFNRKLAQNPILVSTIIPTRDGADAVSLSVVRDGAP